MSSEPYDQGEQDVPVRSLVYAVQQLDSALDEAQGMYQELLGMFITHLDDDLVLYRAMDKAKLLGADKLRRKIEELYLHLQMIRTSINEGNKPDGNG